MQYFPGNITPLISIFLSWKLESPDRIHGVLYLVDLNKIQFHRCGTSEYGDGHP